MRGRDPRAASAISRATISRVAWSPGESRMPASLRTAERRPSAPPNLAEPHRTNSSAGGRGRTVEISLTGSYQDYTNDTAKGDPEQRVSPSVPLVAGPKQRRSRRDPILPVLGNARPSSRHPLMELMEKWKVQDAVETYGVRHWGKGYFGINQAGHVTVHPYKKPEQAVDLKNLIDQLQARGIQLPILLRFTDILRHRVGEIHDAFRAAIQEFDYSGSYCCVYPIKVNQQRHVVEEILDFGRSFNFGLEAGSKPELLAVLAQANGLSTPIICNGFKDDEFIKMAVLARKIGKEIIPVVEKFTELEALVRYAQELNVRPVLGVRVKLASPGSGRWKFSAGFRSKFGLTITEVLEALDFLKARDLADCLQLVHFHLGSQITNI